MTVPFFATKDFHHGPPGPASDLADHSSFSAAPKPRRVYLLTCASGPGVEGGPGWQLAQTKFTPDKRHQWPAADSGLASLATLVYNLRETVGVRWFPPCGMHEGCTPTEEVN